MITVEWQVTIINSWKAVEFLYTNNEASEKEIKKIIQIMIASKTLKYLVLNLIKEIKDLYDENYKTFQKETEDTNK